MDVSKHEQVTVGVQGAQVVSAGVCVCTTEDTTASNSDLRLRTADLTAFTSPSTKVPQHVPLCVDSRKRAQEYLFPVSFLQAPSIRRVAQTPKATVLSFSRALGQVCGTPTGLSCSRKRYEGQMVGCERSQVACRPQRSKSTTTPAWGGMARKQSICILSRKSNVWRTGADVRCCQNLERKAIQRESTLK